MVCFKEVEGEGRFRTIEGRGVPALAKELTVLLVGDVADTALAKSNLYFMPTVGVDDDELAKRTYRARVATMPEIEDVTERMERSPVKKSVLPTLGVMSMRII